MWKFTTVDTWSLMPADAGDGITNGSVVDVMLQYTPNYNFVEGHYYDISITASMTLEIVLQPTVVTSPTKNMIILLSSTISVL